MFTMVLVVHTIKFIIDVHYGSTVVDNQVHYKCSLWFYWYSQSGLLLMFTMVLLVFEIKFTIDVHYGFTGVHNQVYYWCSLWFYWRSQSGLLCIFAMILLVLTIKLSIDVHYSSTGVNNQVHYGSTDVHSQCTIRMYPLLVHCWIDTYIIDYFALCICNLLIQPERCTIIHYTSQEILNRPVFVLEILKKSEQSPSILKIFWT